MKNALYYKELGFGRQITIHFKFVPRMPIRLMPKWMLNKQINFIEYAVPVVKAQNNNEK